uniref:Steroid 5-alpha reductase C-terminal domain-containing protein n=1 Tax=Zea mays TaxID=4577 RepID=A0A804RJT5_MAIZE
MAGGSSLKNMVVAFLVPLPSILFYLSFVRAGGDTGASPLASWCAAHPLVLANVLFFLNVDVLFWLVGLLLSNHWLIDLYWTVIPVMLLHYYRGHPASVADAARSAVAVALTWAWSARLTHNYLRREGWELGKREDWRFNEMRAQYGNTWWWMSFFAVYLSQQPWGVWDLVAAATCVAGILIAHFADTQLHRFVTRNEKLKRLGEPTVPTLEDGLWRYSRHPNYFGEQLWWWGLYLFAWNLGQRWMFLGPLVNSLCLGYVTVLVERRMLKQEHRAEAYKLYQKRTSVWIPWFRKAVPESKLKET